MKSNNFNHLIGTFRKLDIKYVHVLLYDLLFLLPAFFAAVMWGTAVLKNYKGVQSSVSMVQTMEALAGMEKSAAAIKGFLSSSIIYGILLILFLYFLWCFSRSLIWTSILNKKFSFQYYKTFLLLNLIWLPVSLILFFALFIISFVLIYIFMSLPVSALAAVKGGLIIAIPYLHLVFIFIIFPVMLYIYNLASILYIYFTQTDKINTSFEKMTSFVITKITKLYVPYVFMSAVLMLVTWLAYPFKLINQDSFMFATVILLLLYSAWHKFYVSELVAKHL